MKKYTLAIALLTAAPFSMAKLSLGVGYFASQPLPQGNISDSASLSLAYKWDQWRVSVFTSYNLTDSAMGNTSLKLSRKFKPPMPMAPSVSLFVKEKFATATNTTSKNDTSIGVDLFKTLGLNWSLYGGASYTLVGKTDPENQQDTISTNMGFGYMSTSGWSFSAGFDKTQSKYINEANTTTTSLMVGKSFKSVSTGVFVSYDSTNTLGTGVNLLYNF